MNIGIISLNCGGTAGHMSLTIKLSEMLAKKHNKIILITDNDYSLFFKNKKINFEIVKIRKAKHRKTVGGCLNYRYKKSLKSLIKKRNISKLIFSTFYDLDILEYCKLNKIKTVLIGYPLRDSHREAIKLRGYYKHFDHIFTLNEIYDVKKISANEKIVSPMITRTKSVYKKNKKEINILITCGGGGRPSSELFFNYIKKIIPLMVKKYPKIKFTVIRGNYKDKLKLINSKIISWSENFPDLLKKSDLVISEAGYYTLVDIISLNKKAILIPGERRIDNQELRAIKFEQSKLGFAIFPVEDTKLLLERLETFLSKNDQIKSSLKRSYSIKKRLFSKLPIDLAILEFSR